MMLNSGQIKIMTHTFIYALIDPNSNMVRYIGKTDNLERRFKTHTCIPTLNRMKTKRADWIKSLIKKEQVPILKPLMKVPFEKWQFIEQEMIKHYKQFSPLTNLTAGGDGFLKGTHSLETREKLSKSHKGIPTGRKGMKLSPEWCKKLSESHKGKGGGEQHYLFGKHLSEETKQKKRDAMKRRKEKYGYIHSQETRKKISVSQKIRRANEMNN